MRISKFLGRFAFAVSLAALLFAQPHAAFADDPPSIPFTEPAGVAESLDALTDQIAGLATQIGKIWQNTRFCSQAEKNEAYKDIAKDYDRLRELQQQLANLKSGAATLMTTPMGKSYFLNDTGPRPDETSYWTSANNGLKEDADLIKSAREYLASLPVVDCTDHPPQPQTPPVPPGPVKKQMPALPPAPPFSLAPLVMPPYFCSQKEWTDFRFNVMWPYITAMRQQASAWAAYDAALAQLAAQYSGDPDIYPYVRSAEDAADAKATQAADYADEVEKTLPAQMGKIPVKDCAPPAPQTPQEPGGYHGPTNGLPPPSVELPTVPDCFENAAQKETMASSATLQLNALEASQMTPGDKQFHDQTQANIEALRQVLDRIRATGLCKKEKPGLLDGLQIGIGIGLGGGHDHDRHDDDRGRGHDRSGHPQTHDNKTTDKPKPHNTDGKLPEAPKHGTAGDDKVRNPGGDTDSKTPDAPKRDSVGDDRVRSHDSDTDTPHF
jgi:hypothetical protein